MNTQSYSTALLLSEVKQTQPNKGFELLKYELKNTLAGLGYKPLIKYCIDIATETTNLKGNIS